MKPGWFTRELLERKAQRTREKYEQVDANVFRLLDQSGPLVHAQCLSCGDMFTHRNRDGYARCARCRSEAV